MLDWFNKLTQTQKMLVVAVVGLLVYYLWSQSQTPRAESFLPQQQQDKPTNVVIVLFHVKWCPHCKRVLPMWERYMQRNLSKFAAVDCDEKVELAKIHGVTAYPTIKCLPHGLNSTEDAVEYKGDNSPEDIEKFVNSF